MNKNNKETEFNLKPTENYIFRGDFFDISFAKYFTPENEESISKKINTKNQRLIATEPSYRIINHWENIGLLTANRPADKGWRNYSIMDQLWIRIIIELRNFGFSLDKIKKVKLSLNWLNDKFKYSEFPILEMYFMYAFLTKNPTYLIVFSNGDAEPVIKDEYELAETFKILKNHIKINLNDILQKVFPKKDLEAKIELSVELSSEEFELLYMIRMDDYESISLKTNEGKITRIEATEPLDVKMKFEEILKKGDYQNIEIKQRQGQIRYIKRSIKKDI